MTFRFPSAVVRLLVALAALAGALLSSAAVDDDDSPAKATATPAAVVAAAAPELQQRLQRVLPATAEQLVTARRAGRKKLAASRSPGEQAKAARALAAAYARASKRLAREADAAGESKLLGALDRASNAYQLLAEAARAHDRPGYKVARAEVAASERRLPKAFSAALSG